MEAIHKKVSRSPSLERPRGVSGFKHFPLCILFWCSYKPSQLAREALGNHLFSRPTRQITHPQSHGHTVITLRPTRDTSSRCSYLSPSNTPATQLSTSYPPPGSDPSFALPPPIVPLQTPCPPRKSPPNPTPPIFDILLKADSPTVSFYDLLLVPIAPMLGAGPLDVGEKENQ